MWRRLAAILWNWFLSLLWFLGWLIWAYFIKPNLWVVALALLGVIVCGVGFIYGLYRLFRYWRARRTLQKEREVCSGGQED